MELLTPAIRRQLLDNGRRQAAVTGTEDEIDFVPIVKLFTPDAQCTWLLTELDPDDEDLAFGLCDLGLGFPELGAVCISKLMTVRGRLGLPVERDLTFSTRQPLSAWADTARRHSAIVDPQHTNKDSSK